MHVVLLGKGLDIGAGYMKESQRTHMTVPGFLSRNPLERYVFLLCLFVFD
jgi:hypothetical protein